MRAADVTRPPSTSPSGPASVAAQPIGLEYLAATGTVELSFRYGATGRPEHLYRWAGTVSAAN